MINANTTLNENTETGAVPENFKIEAPKPYEAPDYTIQEYPAPTNPYERKGFGFDPSGANRDNFINYVRASRLIRERGGDEMLRRGGVMNCLYSINNMYRYIPANEAYREFFGGDIPIDQAEAELDRLYDIACNSEDALGKFLKLDDARQEKIIRQNVQGGRVKKAYTATGSSGGAIVADIDNPDFDMGKGREEYENILRAKNTWEGYLQLRNNFSPEVVRDAMRFKTATAESRSNVAEAVLVKMREKGPEYRAAFLASLDVLGVNIKDASDHNFFERAFTRISEAWTDSGVNMADKFWYSRTDGRVLYGMAEEMGLIDESGNLTEDASKLGKLKQAYEDSQNTAAIRALGSVGGWGSKPAYKDTEIQKLFDEGKENIETRRMYRNLRANLATQYNYSGDEWKTLEDMFVYGEYTLRAIGVSAATLAATKNPFMASLASVPMMFAEETARMYSELRLDAGLTESQASLLAMQYGVAVSAAEQFQLGRFMGSFVGKSAAKSFKEYVFNNFKGGVKKAIKESALETGVELSQNTYDLATKIFAAEAFGAGFNTDQLLDNYVEDFKSAALITPLITTFIFGVGAPFRFSGTLSNVGANYGTAAKTLLGIKPSEVVENNVETFETIRAAGEYEALVKSKYGATEQGRDFLLKYLNAKDSVERNSILQKRFPDVKERAEAKLFLENFKRLDSEAFDSILKVKIEAAQKREEEVQSILKGDTTDISALDAETTDEAGNISYEILNSAIDALGMRDDVVFVNNAQELAQASGMSLNAAEDVISRKGAKGFFDEKNGKIAIIKSHFASGADALQSFAHEYGHKIMAKIRANDLNGYKRMCSDVLDLIGGEAVARASLPDSYSQVGHANYAKDSLDVAEESLMRVLEQVALKRVLDARKKSVWARFKGWFQKLFSEKSLADITNERLAQIALDVLQKEKSFNVSVPNAPSRNWRAKTPEADGEYVSGEWEVVDAGDLKTSLDAGYDDALQPRNRGRQSSKEQVLNIANNLDPELLDNDPRTSDGAPIVDSRSMAVSGNGRILAIRQAYESGKAEEYRRHVLSRANSMGIDVPAGIKNPVLIRRVMDTGNMSIEELAARSNKSSVAGMSVAEQAVADGRRISEAGLLDIFFPGADGNILAESNRDFNNAFLNLVGGSETFRNKDGSLRTNLSPRVRAAVLAAMLNSGGNRDIVERLLDNPEGYNALINGLMQCAANLAELAQKPQYDISGELSQAVELYIEMHDKGQTVTEFEAQPDMFREQPSAEVMFLCRLFEANQKSPSGISGVLKEYAAQCKKIDTTTADLFGEEDPSKLDKLQAAYDHYATDLAQGMDNLRALDRGNSAYANPLGIVSWQMRDFTLSNARRSTLEYQKNGVDFLAQPRESSMRDDSPKTLSESENNSENQENSSKKWREVFEPSPEEIAAIDKRHAELYERYKNGDISAYDEAVELVRQEAENKGYETQAYHGTGADAFNVADATSKHKEFGEGNQAHGPGLYMAANRDTAENYRENERGKLVLFIDGKGYYDVEVPWGLDKKYAKEYFLDKAKENGNKELVETIEKAKKLEVKKSKGHLFDWFHNMKPDELLEEQNPNSVEKSAVGEKYKKAWFEDILPTLRREYGYDVDELDSVKRLLSFHNSAKTIARNGSIILGGNRFREIMLKHGIRGITYDGRQDGRAFVSFEGGATVKLQDPFTFDDEGNLIPLSERFDEANPDMRWKIDEAINGEFSDTIESVISEIENIKKSGMPTDLKSLKTKYEKLDSNKKKIIEELSPWEDRQASIQPTPWGNGGDGNISARQRDNSQLKTSPKYSENQEKNSHLKALLRQERSENPVIWASIVLAREILLGRPITSAKIDKVLPQGKFDGTKRQYALDRAKHIAEHCKATQKNYANRIDEAVKLAEIDVYWKHDVMEEMYRSYRKDGEEYGIAKQKLLDWIKNEQRKDLEKVKGFSSDELGIDVPAEIENALQEEPVRKKAEESQGETEDKEEIESIAEDGIDDEILGTREKLAPSSLREIIDKIRIAVTKKVKARGGDEQTRRRVYRNTLVEVLSESAKELTYGRERELIQQNIRGLGNLAYHNANSLQARAIELKNKRDLAEKDKSLKSDYIETYNNIQGIYFGTYSGRGGVMNYFVKNYLDNPSQIPDPYSIYAEHIALRIFNRGVRDSKAQLLERFGGIIKRKGKKPSRMERDDKRKMAGAVQMRIYKIGKFAEMDAAELEAEYFAAVDKLNNAGVHFAGDSDNGETNKDFTDIEDIRAEAANTIADIQRFGNLREKSRADMAGAVEFLEKHIEEEMQKQEELIAKKKEEAAKKRKVVSDALRMSKHNAHKDGALRSGGRALINKTMPFDSLLAVLGEYATGETFLAFDAWRKDLVARIDRAAALVANETFRALERLINIVEECYSENFSDALKRLLKPDVKYEEFSNLGGESEGMKQPMSLANVLQLYASALQENYRQNVYAHRAKKNGDVEKLQMKIDEILESYPDKESKKGEGWKSASEEIKSLENRIVGLQKNAVSDYIERIEKVLTDADKKFVELLRKEYADALPALSAVSRRVIGLPIEQADALYIPAKIKREKTFGEAAGQVPVVPKILSPRVQHMRDFDETANPISLYLDRVRENAQFKYFSELYIEMRSIFGSEELQDLISQRCGSNTLQELLDFIVDISTGQTRGYKDEYIQKANGLFALVALGFNLGSGVRQILPGCFSWGTYIGTPSVLKNMAAFFTPEGFSAALEIWRSENGRRRFSIGNLQIMEEMLATPDQNKFWALFKRYALVFNRASDMLAISFVGQGVYRAGVENYLRQGFNEAKAKEKAMADMWQIAERTQASGRMHNMARWQRRGGDLGKGIGMFSAPPQLMFSKSAQDIRRAIALGIKTPEGRVAAWQALKTWATVSILVEGSYAASGVLWNALLKGFFDDDDDERIIKQMATGPFGGLFLFGRMIENSTSNRGIESIMPVAGLARPAGNIYDLTLDLMTFDLDKALEDLDKLGKSTVPLYRDFRKVIDNRILEEN